MELEFQSVTILRIYSSFFLRIINDVCILFISRFANIPPPQISLFYLFSMLSVISNPHFPTALNFASYLSVVGETFKALILKNHIKVVI